MKYNKLIFLAMAVLLLSACSAAKDKTESSTNKQASSSKVSVEKKEAEKDRSSSQDTRSESDSAESKKEQKQDVTVDKNVSYNGSYYSVQGKYDEIVIANKHYPLSADYNPGEDPTAKAELLKLIADMQSKGYPISNQYSGFRSYQTQVGLYQSYVNRPGYSEHQTGLAFDLIDSNGNLVEEAGASQWLLDNAYKYGFVVRYPVGKEDSTGYVPESWHLRYVGKEAKEISESGLTLEEYYHFTGGNYVH